MNASDDSGSMWYYTFEDQQRGPVTFEQLQELAKSGKLDRFTSMAWTHGMACWVAAHQVKGLFEDPPPPPLRVTSPVPTAETTSSSPALSSSPSAPAEATDLAQVAAYLLWAAVASLAIEVATLGATGLFTAVGFLLAISGGIVQVLWLHRAWGTVPAEYRSFTPGQAVGLLFVPVFNVYWGFRAYPGLCATYDRILRDRGRQADVTTSEYTLAVAYCITVFIPVVNIFAIILLAIWLAQANRQRRLVIKALDEVGRETKLIT